MIKKIFNLKIRNQGFTLIEILVSVSVFVLVIIAAMAILNSTLFTKRRVYQLKEIEDNGRYSLELMSREIRTGAISDSQAGIQAASITFINSDRDTITYNLSNGIITRQAGASVSEITSDKVTVSNLKFYVNDFVSNNEQPIVVITIEIQAAANPLVSMNFQTTVSILTYN